MAANVVYDSEMLPVVVAHRKVRRSRCMCLLFLFLIATFVGLGPIMVYRSLGVPLPEGLKGYRNVYVSLPFLPSSCLRCPLIAPTGILRQPWVIVSQLNAANESPAPLDGVEAQVPWPAQQQSSETNTKPISIPRAHLHPPKRTQFPTSITTPDAPTTTNLHPAPVP
jgi:hypothetical protein